MKDFIEQVTSIMPDAVYRSGSVVFVDAAVALEVVDLAEAADVINNVKARVTMPAVPPF